MATPHNPLPDLQALDINALRAPALQQHADLLSRDIEIDSLKLLVLKLKRMQFGQKSEKLDRQIAQLELCLEDLEAAPAAAPVPATAPAAQPQAVCDKPARRPLPESLPRITRTHAPKHETCPDCGSKLRPLGEDVSEMLEYVPAHFEVIRLVRPKLSCAVCERIVQAPTPSRPIDRGLAGPRLLAHVLVSKYADHLPLYRQSEIYEREGVELDRSTLAGWVGAKTSSGTGRVIPMNDDLASLLASHRAWFVERFGAPKQEHYVFPFGSPQPTDPDKPVTDISSGWDLVRATAGVSCRLHDLRHTFCTRLAEAGVPESTMLALMGHMSRAMLERYSHIRMAAKRDAVAAITLRPAVQNSAVVPVKVPVAVQPGQIQ